MPKTTCVHCGQHIEFPAELEGSETSCPHCDQTTSLHSTDFPTIRIPQRPTAKPTKRPAAAESPVATVTQKILANIEQVIVGKTDEIKLVLSAYLANGHVLLEDVPGVAKTMLARALAQSIGCAFKRIQCTPDLLPNDITGTSIFNPKTTDFEFRPGPLFAQIVLADEINRATPRAQSALLEAMEERKVTADGTNYELSTSFFLIATQNPIDHEGTFPLPEAQLDRFLMRLSLGYPGPDHELEILQRLQFNHPIEQLEAVTTEDEIRQCQTLVQQIQVDEKIARYVVDIVQSSRAHQDLALGASPRASLAIIRSAQAFAGIQGYDYVLPDDIKRLAPYILGHRLILRPESRLRKRTTEDVIDELLSSVNVPTLASGNER